MTANIHFSKRESEALENMPKVSKAVDFVDTMLAEHPVEFFNHLANVHFVAIDMVARAESLGIEEGTKDWDCLVGSTMSKTGISYRSISMMAYDETLKAILHGLLLNETNIDVLATSIATQRKCGRVVQIYYHEQSGQFAIEVEWDHDIRETLLETIGEKFSNSWHIEMRTGEAAMNLYMGAHMNNAR